MLMSLIFSFWITVFFSFGFFIFLLLSHCHSLFVNCKLFFFCIFLIVLLSLSLSTSVSLSLTLIWLGANRIPVLSSFLLYLPHLSICTRFFFSRLTWEKLFLGEKKVKEGRSRCCLSWCFFFILKHILPFWTQKTFV